MYTLVVVFIQTNGLNRKNCKRPGAPLGTPRTVIMLHMPQKTVGVYKFDNSGGGKGGGKHGIFF